MELTLGTRHWHNTVTMLHAVHLSHVHIIINFIYYVSTKGNNKEFVASLRARSSWVICQV